MKVVPEKIPSIYNGEKTVIYGLLMEKSEQKGRNMKCKATLTGDLIGKKFKLDIPFELTEEGPGEADVSVVHQLAVKGMIQEWQDDKEPYEQRHKKEIIELSTDASVVSKYTAYIAVDLAQNKPVSGSMQSYQLTAYGEPWPMFRRCRMYGRANSGGDFDGAMVMKCSAPPMKKGSKKKISASPRRMMESEGISQAVTISEVAHFNFDNEEALDELTSVDSLAECKRITTLSSKQTGASLIVSLQQANGSWLLNDQLAGVVSKSVEELKSCCPVSCDDTMMANIWATLVVIELLKKKYPSMLDELELVIMKAEQWLNKQVLPSGINLTTMKENAFKII